jgi:RNA polymerase sigma factor (sigma-70 family)
MRNPPLTYKSTMSGGGVLTEEEWLLVARPIIKRVAANFAGHNDDLFDDFCQEGRIAALKAFGTYDPSKSVPTTYIWQQVRSCVLHINRHLKLEQKHRAVVVYYTHEAMRDPCPRSERTADYESRLRALAERLRPPQREAVLRRLNGEPPCPGDRQRIDAARHAIREMLSGGTTGTE